MADINQESAISNQPTKEDVFRKKFWDELCQAKFNEEYLKEYCINRKELNDQLKYGYLFLSIIGLCLKNYQHGSFIVLIIITVIALYELIYKNVFPEKNSIGSLNAALTFYNNYFVELDCLWWKYQTDQQNLKSCMNKFWEIKKTESSINKIVNDTLEKPDEEIKEKADELTGLFLRKYY